MRWRETVTTALGLVALVAVVPVFFLLGASRAQGAYGIGRPATPAEIDGWRRALGQVRSH